ERALHLRGLAERHRLARVHQDGDLELLVDGELPDDVLTESGANVPVQVPDVVTRLVGPEVSELEARTQGPGPPLAHAHRRPRRPGQELGPRQLAADLVGQEPAHLTSESVSSRSSMTIAGADSPSDQPSKLSWNRWLRAGRATALRSSASTANRPEMSAWALAARTSVWAPLGLTPNFT